MFFIVTVFACSVTKTAHATDDAHLLAEDGHTETLQIVRADSDRAIMYGVRDPDGELHYTNSWSELERLVRLGWSSEGIFDWLPPTTDMYRLYNRNSGEHFYTASDTERNHLISVGWDYEGVAWTAPAISEAPVYRLYSGTDHHYTTDADEVAGLINKGWRFEGVSWYSDTLHGVSLYRLFNPNVDPVAPRNNSGSHHYTTSALERDTLELVGWNAEGIGWYGASVKVGSTTKVSTVPVGTYYRYTEDKESWSTESVVIELEDDGAFTYTSQRMIYAATMQPWPEKWSGTYEVIASEEPIVILHYAVHGSFSRDKQYDGRYVLRKTDEGVHLVEIRSDGEKAPLAKRS